jgi:molybdopterin-guanine dinucleotide biosynthesis protein A
LPPERTLVVLAGGQGRRFGGRRKTALLLGGRPLLERQQTRCAVQADTLLLSLPPDHDEACPIGFTAVYDPEPGGRGPLAGIREGLAWLNAHQPDRDCLYSVACDLPWMPMDFADRLDAVAAARADVLVVAASAGREHPVCARWPRRCLAALDDALSAPRAPAVGAFQRAYGRELCSWEVVGQDPFFNVNTPADLARAASYCRP